LSKIILTVAFEWVAFCFMFESFSFKHGPGDQLPGWNFHKCCQFLQENAGLLL